MGELYDVNRLMRRPCNFSQLQNEWPKVVDYLTATDEGQVITTTATNAWHKGGGSPYVVTPLGTINLTAHPSKDWNIPAGWAVRVKKIPGGFRVIDDLLDDKIGTVKLWGAGTVPTGWAKMNGTDNASPAGSGYNMTGKYAKGAGTAGTTGGSTSYTPAGSVSISSITGTVTVTVDDHEWGSATAPTEEVTFSGSASTSTESLNLSALTTDSYTLAEHDSHDHPIIFTTANISTTAGGTTVVTGITTPTDINFDYGAPGVSTHGEHESHTHSHSTWTSVGSHSHTFDGSSFDHTHDIMMSAWDHGHTASGSLSGGSGSGTFSGTPATIEPPFVELFYIERIDNSSG